MNAFRGDDRVLLLAIPATSELAALARILIRGVVVALGTPEEIAAARGQFAEFDNVMLLDAGPDRIPWHDASFSKIVVPRQYERILPHISGELHRLLAPGGEIIQKAASVS